jgi:hypothetical protein
MHWYSFLSLYLWVAPHLLLGVIALLLIKRRLHTTFPLFFLYLWYEIAEFLVLFSIARLHVFAAIPKLNHGTWYVRVFVITGVISAALRFGVTQEIFNRIFREPHKVDALAWASLRWAVALLLLGAVVFSIFLSGQAPVTLIAGEIWVGRGIAVIQCGMVLFLLLFSRLLGLSLGSWMFGIALGFGILSSAELAYFALRTGELSTSIVRALNLLLTGGYHLAVLIWIGYLVAPAKETVQPRELPIGDIRHWNSELERFLQ